MSSVEHKAATDFLRQLAPQGPWQLHSISPDQQKLETELFGKSDAAGKWIGARAGDVNLYYTPNPIKGSPRKKPEKTDIKEGRWCWIDLDYAKPVDGEPMSKKHMASERKRLLDILKHKLPAGVPTPTAIVFTGGGYQALWKLAEPFPIDGQQAAWEEYERYNRGLADAFGADHCWNVERILRLPGTMNIPSEKKKQRGRIPEMAELISFTSVAYSLKQLPVAPPRRPGIDVSSRPGTGATIVADIRARKLDTLEQLDEWKVSGLCKTVIAQGHDPDEPNRFESGSEAQWFVTCELQRCGVPEPLILGIIADGTWLISGHVRRQKNPHNYALGQIAKAKEAANDPAMAEFYFKYFVLRDSRGTKVCNWERNVNDPSGRDVLFQQSVADFHVWKANEKKVVQIDGKDKELAVSKLWFASPKRKQFTGLFFDPDRPEVDEGSLNLWRGLAIEPKPGSWRLMKRHIRNVLAKKDKESFRYIMRWAAWSLQHPGGIVGTALAFRGKQGAGKGMFARALVKLFGQHGFHTSSSEQFSGRFNSHLQDCCLLFADEAIAPDDKAAENRLKTMITEPTLPIEGKGKDIVSAASHLKIIMASNADWIARVSGDDRRMAVFDVAPPPTNRDAAKAYFDALNAELNAGGYAAMLHDLLRLDLSKWDAARIPDTEAREDQKEASRSVYYEDLKEYLGDITDGRMRGMTLQRLLFPDIRDRTAKVQRAVAQACRELGWTGGRNVMVDKVQGTFWTIGNPKAKEWTLAELKPELGGNVIAGPFGDKATQNRLPLGRKG